MGTHANDPCRVEDANINSTTHFVTWWKHVARDWFTSAADIIFAKLFQKWLSTIKDATSCKSVSKRYCGCLIFPLTPSVEIPLVELQLPRPKFGCPSVARRVPGCARRKFA
ncbi:hypothetical protein L3X38_025852 [Prunus dulcis]|nr:hypothetical protein L3X38_025852 [Prunus dulcis]